MGELADSACANYANPKIAGHSQFFSLDCMRVPMVAGGDSD
jgi:hypothetical protein